MLIQYNTHAFWRTTLTTQVNGDYQHRYQSCTWPWLIPTGYQSYTWSLSGPLCQQSSCSGYNNGINLVVVLEYTFFKLFSNKSFRFRKFKNSYINLPFVASTNQCQYCTAFFAWCALFRVVTFLFLQLCVPNNVFRAFA